MVVVGIDCRSPGHNSCLDQMGKSNKKMGAIMLERSKRLNAELLQQLLAVVTIARKSTLAHLQPPPQSTKAVLIQPLPCFFYWGRH